MRDYGYTLSEHDPGKPWLIIRREHRTVTLEDDEQFYRWASKEWPAQNYTVELDPWQ